MTEETALGRRPAPRAGSAPRCGPTRSPPTGPGASGPPRPGRRTSSAPGWPSTSIFGERVMHRLLARQVGHADRCSRRRCTAWTYDPRRRPDALAVLGTDDRSWGRAWHVPTAPRGEPARARGPAVRRRASTPSACTTCRGRSSEGAAGVAVSRPMLRELQETRHQFDGPFVLDSSQFTTTFGIRPTSLGEALPSTPSTGGASAWACQRPGFRTRRSTCRRPPAPAPARPRPRVAGGSPSCHARTRSVPCAAGGCTAWRPGAGDRRARCRRP